MVSLQCPIHLSFVTVVRGNEIRAYEQEDDARRVQTSVDGWADFGAQARIEGRRILLFTTKAAEPYQRFAYRPDDVLLFGRESAGVPDAVHDAADARLIIPIRSETRSLNVVSAAAMALGEALRQTNAFPAPPAVL